MPYHYSKQISRYMHMGSKCCIQKNDHFFAFCKEKKEKNYTLKLLYKIVRAIFTIMLIYWPTLAKFLGKEKNLHSAFLRTWEGRVRILIVKLKTLHQKEKKKKNEKNQSMGLFVQTYFRLEILFWYASDLTNFWDLL